MATDLERRILPSEFNVRSAGENRVVIEGYAYRFRQRSQNLGGFREQIIEGAGAQAAQTDDIRALVNHDPNLILGRNRAGTLRLAEDSTGLPYEVDLDLRQSYALDLFVALERKDVTQSSFGFRVAHRDDETWDLDEDEFPLRSIRKMSLFDVSPVTFPAYLNTESRVSSRALNVAGSMLEHRRLWIPETPALPVDPVVALHALRFGKH